MRRAGASATALTPRGWAVAGAAAGLVVGSRVLGAGDLGGVGIGAALLVGFALVWVARRRPELEARRSVHPSTLHVGQPGQVTLELVTRGRTPLLTLVEPVDGGRRTARFVLGPQPSGAVQRASYPVPTERRGRHQVGPMLASLSDPLGLARRTIAVAGRLEVVVCPRVHVVAAPRRGGGGEPAGHSEGPRVAALEPLGDFLTLRDYEPGDDPRRVHWRATARSGDLVVRQDEAAAPGRVVLVLDTRRSVHDETTFEHAVEAVASLAMALHRARIPSEVTTTLGTVLAPARPANAQVLLERLAVVGLEQPDHLGVLCAALRTRLGIGAVVLVTGSVDAALTRGATLVAAGRRLVTVVATGPGAGATRPGMAFVDASREPFPRAWALHSGRGRGTLAGPLGSGLPAGRR